MRGKLDEALLEACKKAHWNSDEKTGNPWNRGLRRDSGEVGRIGEAAVRQYLGFNPREHLQRRPGDLHGDLVYLGKNVEVKSTTSRFKCMHLRADHFRARSKPDVYVHVWVDTTTGEFEITGSISRQDILGMKLEEVPAIKGSHKNYEVPLVELFKGDLRALS